MLLQTDISNVLWKGCFIALCTYQDQASLKIDWTHTTRSYHPLRTQMDLHVCNSRICLAVLPKWRAGVRPVLSSDGGVGGGVPPITGSVKKEAFSLLLLGSISSVPTKEREEEMERESNPNLLREVRDLCSPGWIKHFWVHGSSLRWHLCGARACHRALV